MKLTVFGATGRVGASFVDRAIAAGHQVTVFARDPARVTNNAAHVITGDVTDAAAVSRALQPDCEAVVSCVGAGPLGPSTLVTDAMRSVVGAMQAHGIKRLLAVSRPLYHCGGVSRRVQADQPRRCGRFPAAPVAG